MFLVFLSFSMQIFGFLGCLSLLTLATAELPDQFLLIAQGTQIRGVDVKSGKDVVSPIKSLFSSDFTAYGVDYAAETKEFIWPDAHAGRILVGNSTHQRTIATGLRLPIDVAYDWISKNVYFTDAVLDIVGVVSLDGDCHITLVKSELDKPRSIVVDPEAGYVFWTDRGSDPKIERAYLSGKNRQTVFQSYGVPIALTLDRKAKTVYWLDSQHNTLESTDYNGAHWKILFVATTRSYDIHPFSAVFDGANVLWSDWTGRFILSAPIARPHQIKLVRRLGITPYGIALYNSSNVGGTNGCAVNNGGCSQLCLPEPRGSHVCACCRGVLQSDNRTCLIDHTKSFPYFLVADYNSARGLDVEALTDVHPPLRGLQLAVAIDYDPLREIIFYTDTYTDKIHAMYPNGTIETLVYGFIHPAGVAVDWIGGYVYFTDTFLNVVGFAKMNTSELVILVRDNMTNPRDIALDLTRGKMYWTDFYNSSGRIERADMDGKNREVIIDNGLEQPSGLTLDIENEVIYWVDTKSLKIEKSNFDGTNRTTVASSLSDPFDLVFYNGSLYWTDWNEKNIVRMQVNASGQPISNATTYATPSPPLRIPSGIALYDPPSRLQIRENLTERYPPYCADSCAEEPRRASASCNENDCCFCPPYCVPVTRDGKLSRRCFCTGNNAHLCHPMPTASIESWNVSAGIITLACKVATGVDVNIPTLYTRWLKGHSSSIAFTWWFGGTTTGTCHYHRLEIPMGQKGDGTYSCSATNTYGTTVSNKITIHSKGLAKDDNLAG